MIIGLNTYGIMPTEINLEKLFIGLTYISLLHNNNGFLISGKRTRLFKNRKPNGPKKKYLTTK